MITLRSSKIERPFRTNQFQLIFQQQNYFSPNVSNLASHSLSLPPKPSPPPYGCSLAIFFCILLSDRQCLLMAERTISISPINSTITLDSLQQEFAGFNIERMALLAENNCAYVQFSSAGQVETLANKYPDCHVTALAGAEIGFVEQGFKWPSPKGSAKAESLVVVKNCDRVGETSEARIRQVFKQFAIEKVVKFEETGEIVLQFHSQDDLELIDMHFDNFRIPELGPKAEIEVDNAFPVDRFIQRYLLCNQVRVVENKKQEQQPTQQPIQPPGKNQEAITKYLKSKEQEKLSKEAQSKRKMEQMQREIMQKEKARRSQVEAYERTRREKEEKERIERFAREKREREERERCELIELEQQKKLQNIRQAQLQQEQKALEQLFRKEAVERERMREEEQQRFLAERISSIKQEVEEEERQMRERQQAANINEVPSAELSKDLSEPELEQILNQQRQAKKKSIKLPEINKFVPKENITEQIKNEDKPKPQNIAATQFVKKDYSITSVHFITAFMVVWIYYILVR